MRPPIYSPFTGFFRYHSGSKRAATSFPPDGGRNADSTRGAGVSAPSAVSLEPLLGWPCSRPASVDASATPSTTYRGGQGAITARWGQTCRLHVVSVDTAGQGRGDFAAGRRKVTASYMVFPDPACWGSLGAVGVQALHSASGSGLGPAEP